MKSYLKILLICVAFLVLTACASKPPVPPEAQSDFVPPYKPNGIQVYLKADPQLNLYEGNPHTLVLYIYQLQDPNSFNQYAQDEEGLYKLLEGSRFDATVTNARKLVVQPGQPSQEGKTYSLDRAEGTRFVGVVAGYFVLQVENVVRLFQIPIIVETKGLIRKKKSIKADILYIDLYLGPQRMQTMERG